MVEEGCRITIRDAGPPATFNMPRTTSSVLEIQQSAHSGRRNQDSNPTIPNEALIALTLKSALSKEDTSFPSTFHNSFHQLMISHHDNDTHNCWALGALGKLGKTCQMVQLFPHLLRTKA